MNHDTMPAYVRRVLGRLKGLRPTHDGWDALCPCPDHNNDGDQHPSLGIGLGEDGRILINCRVGCLTDAILEAAGLDWPDLFRPNGTEEGEIVEELILAPVVCIERADADLCHRAYEMLLKQLSLGENHRQDLRRRGLPDDQIDRRGYRSLRNVDRGNAKAVHQELGDGVLAVPGFVRGEYGITLYGEATGLLIPVRDLQGRIQAVKIRREKGSKYVYLSGSDEGPSSGSPLHVPLGICRPAEVVRVTEGELKADVCMALDGTPTLGVPGVPQWRSALPVLKELGAKTVILAYDAPDMHTMPPVFEQAELFCKQLETEGFEVEVEDWNEQVQGD